MIVISLGKPKESGELKHFKLLPTFLEFSLIGTQEAEKFLLSSDHLIDLNLALGN